MCFFFICLSKTFGCISCISFRRIMIRREIMGSQRADNIPTHSNVLQHYRKRVHTKINQTHNSKIPVIATPKRTKNSCSQHVDVILRSALFGAVLYLPTLQHGDTLWHKRQGILQKMLESYQGFTHMCICVLYFAVILGSQKWNWRWTRLGFPHQSRRWSHSRFGTSQGPSCFKNK